MHFFHVLCLPKHSRMIAVKLSLLVCLSFYRAIFVMTREVYFNANRKPLICLDLYADKATLLHSVEND